MANITVVIPNPDVPDALEAMEGVWLSEAARLAANLGLVYDDLTDNQKLRVLLGSVLRARVRNVRRERAERQLPTIPDIEVS